MSKKSSFRGLFDKQHGKSAKALLKCASEHLYHIHWSLPSQLNQKKSVLLTWKNLVLLVNTLAADEKYPVLNWDNLTIPIQMQLSQKQKNFSQFFPAFLKASLNFKHFEKNMTLLVFVFWNLRTLKTSLDKCLKSSVSEDSWATNMADLPNHFWYLHHSICFIFIDYFQVNLVGKASPIDLQNPGISC